QTIQNKASTPEPTSLLPRTAEWGRRSSPHGTPAHQSSQLTIQLPLLRPAILPPPAKTLMEPIPGTRISATDPTKESSLSPPAPNSTPANFPGIVPSLMLPGTPPLTTPFHPPPPSATHSPSTPLHISPHYHQHMEQRFTLIKERLAPCEQQIAQLTD
ncbi:unnamed protein product, partial [Ixodes hexagonus]